MTKESDPSIDNPEIEELLSHNSERGKTEELLLDIFKKCEPTEKNDEEIELIDPKKIEVELRDPNKFSFPGENG